MTNFIQAFTKMMALRPSTKMFYQLAVMWVKNWRLLLQKIIVSQQLYDCWLTVFNQNYTKIMALGPTTWSLFSWPLKWRSRSNFTSLNFLAPTRTKLQTSAQSDAKPFNTILCLLPLSQSSNHSKLYLQYHVPSISTTIFYVAPCQMLSFAFLPF